MRAEGCSARAPLVGTGLMSWTSKPSVTELVVWRWVFHLLGMRRQGLVGFTIVKLLAVHVGMRSHRASLHRSVNPEGQMPGVRAVLSVHGEDLQASGRATTRGLKSSTRTI